MRRLPRSVHPLAAGVVCALTVAILHAQDGQSGIFVEIPDKTGDEARQRLESSMMQSGTGGMMKSALTGGFAGVQQSGEIEGRAAATRLPSGASSFLFIFAPKDKRTPKMPTNLDDALANTWDMSSLPPTANSPKDFTLIRLEVRDDVRRADLGKAGGMMGGRPKPKDPIEFTLQEIAPNTYRVKPKAPLPPGEYLFYFTEQGGGMVWDFGVDGR